MYNNHAMNMLVDIYAIYTYKNNNQPSCIKAPTTPHPPHLNDQNKDLDPLFIPLKNHRIEHNQNQYLYPYPYQDSDLDLNQDPDLAT